MDFRFAVLHTRINRYSVNEFNTVTIPDWRSCKLVIIGGQSVMNATNKNCKGWNLVSWEATDIKHVPLFFNQSSSYWIIQFIHRTSCTWNHSDLIEVLKTTCFVTCPDGKWLLQIDPQNRKAHKLCPQKWRKRHSDPVNLFHVQGPP